jgi:Bacterial sugar transferase
VGDKHLGGRGQGQRAGPARRHSPSPYRTISDKELTLVHISCDFVCACIAFPLSLVLLSDLSAVPVNASGQLLTNMQIDSLFPVAVVIALASGCIYRVTHRRLQPSSFLEIRELSFGVGEGCVLALAIGSLLHVVFATAEPYATQLVMAVVVTVGTMTVGRIIFRYFLHALTTTRVLVVGAGTTADRITLSVRQGAGMTLVGRIADDGDADALGQVADLPRLCDSSTCTGSSWRPGTNSPSRPWTCTARSRISRVTCRSWGHGPSFRASPTSKDGPPAASRCAPGITGLWHVSGRNDLTRNDLVQLDYLYVASWSLWWDLKIMFETPKTMVRGIGAY